MKNALTALIERAAMIAVTAALATGADVATSGPDMPLVKLQAGLAGGGSGVSFEPAVNYPAGAGPYSVAVGDFNGDGVQDIAVTNGFSNNVSVLLGNGDGTFQGPGNLAVGSLPTSVAVGDFNGDGVPDLAAANFDSSNVSVLLGNGDGSFQAARNFAVGCLPDSVAVGDFNGDGVQDLAVAYGCYPADGVSVLLGNGDGSFQAARNFAAGSNPWSVAVGDFNGDEIQDLAVANRYSANVSVLLSNGDGTFQAARNFAVGSLPYSVAVGDFNSDGVSDLAIANAGDCGEIPSIDGCVNSSVSALLGNGDGTLQVARNFTVGRFPTSVAVGDFNRDGLEDLVVANLGTYPSYLDSSVSVLINNTRRP